ncbi:hypothetical protein QVD17_18424 [Tagetes erecta]|uniref:H15 domain-containing protein n=1 Tax=Tagetes erecta TaxID=13708 RepID=A0AAD8KI24_TARER|nr:hypothetical protein QVD17_18424 [Tagetes erecta]
MEKLKEALIQFTHSNPSLFPNDAGDSYPLLIEQCFPQFFADFQTPNHPPYAAMIYQAIRKLNKKGGSSEKSISKYIKKEYADLPWAHSTLLKHHLEKLCDRKELCTTDKQCYLLAGAESETGKESNSPTKKRKKKKSQSGSETGKKSIRPHKKVKKKEKRVLDVKETIDKEQIGLHNRKRKRKLRLKSKLKSSKRVKKHEISKGTNDEPCEQNQTLEVDSSDIQIEEQNEVGQESHHDNSGSINIDQSQTNNDPGDQQIEEQNEVGQELHHDNSGCVNFEQSQTNNVPDLLQLEESLDPTPVLHRDGKRVWTRSQLKTILKEDKLAVRSELTDSLGCANMPKDKPAIVEDLPNEKLQISRSPSLEKPLIELLKPISSKSMPLSPADEPKTGPSSTEMQDPSSTQQDQQPEKSPVEDEPKCKRRGRRPKHTKPENNEVLDNSKSEAGPSKRQKPLKKGRVGNRKDQLKYKRNGMHNMTRRSSKRTRS